ncbi:MAG: secretin N-terminal domain-containing protein, partial [Deinococcus sp.]|nr:secretin N-terminal domain-containing protein [Deinococcus sp.]
MKYATALFVTAALGLGAAQTAPVSAAPAAQTSALSAVSDPALSQANITIETGRYQGPLSGLLGAIAKSAGYELVLEVNVDTLAAEGQQARPVAYSFRDKPFNEVWPLLMDVYGLTYSVTQLGGQPVLRVSNAPVQRVVKLQNADPVAAVNQVKLFFGTPVYSETAQKDTAGNSVATSRTIVDVKFDSPTLRIIPDTRNRSVIVRGNNSEITQVERLLRELDQDPRGAQAGASTGPNVQEIYSVNGDIKELSDFVSAEFPNLRVSTVGSSKQLVLRGGQEDVGQAVALLTKVDPVPGQTTQRVFQLVNAGAEELAETLMVTLARDLTSATGTAASTSTASGTNAANGAAGAPATGTPAPAAAAAPTQMATILPDARTNTIIVRGTPVQVAQVAELIPTLDREVPQINLQVRIQEITESAQRSLGVDWKAGFGGFEVGLVSSGTSPTGLTASFDPTRSLVGFNIFPTLNALETQAQAKRVYDGVITMQSGQRSLGSNASNGSR